MFPDQSDLQVLDSYVYVYVYVCIYIQNLFTNIYILLRTMG